MLGLVTRSLRYRTGGFVASFLALFFGAVILMTFASMLDTGFVTGIDDASSTTLTTVTGVVGGWGLIIVAFAVGSTLTLLVRQRTRQFADGLIAVILFTCSATGTLYMQAIENSAVETAGIVKSATDKNVETLNLVVVAMITLFAAVMLINTLAAAITHRRNEFGQQRLAGSTPPQVLGMVSVEGVLLAMTGVLFGSVAAVAAIVPYSIARTGSAMPDESILIYVVIVSIATFLTLAASLGATRRAIRMPAIRAVTP